MTFLAKISSGTHTKRFMTRKSRIKIVTKLDVSGYYSRFVI